MLNKLRLRLVQIAMLLAGVLLITYLVIGSRLRRNLHIRYELTIKVRTPDGVLAGASVIQATIERGIPLWGDSGEHYRVTGNAPAVELPDGRLVLAVLKGTHSVSLPARAARDAAILPAGTRARVNQPTARIWARLKRECPIIIIEAAHIAVQARKPLSPVYPATVVICPEGPQPVRAIDWAHPEDALGAGFGLTGIEVRIVKMPPDTHPPDWQTVISNALDALGKSPFRDPNVTLANFLARRTG